MSDVLLVQGDARMIPLADESCHCAVCSPPFFGLRRYDCGDAQIGLEPTPTDFIAAMVAVGREIRRVLRSDGTWWLNLGSSYASRDSHGASCDNCGKGQAGYPEHDYLFENLCGECLVDLLNRKFRIAHLHDPRHPSLSSKSKDARTRSSQSHHANSHSGHLVVHNSDATDHFEHNEYHVAERLPAFPVSTLDESSPLLRGASIQMDNRVYDHALSGSSSPDAQVSVRSEDVHSETVDCTQGNVLPCAGQEHHSRYTSGYCSCCGSYSEHLLTDIQAHCTACESNMQFKPKDLLMIPAQVAIALRDDGWWLRSEITWCKKAPMPESVRDRPTSATEKIFLLTKAARYFYDADAVREPNSRSWHLEGWAQTKELNKKQRESFVPTYGEAKTHRGDKTIAETYNPAGRNMWNYWLLGPEPYPGSHYAVFPTEIPRRAILASTSEHGCCPACGAPWRRVVERGNYVKCGHVEADHNHKRADIPSSELSPSSALRTGRMRERLTTGWEPTCSCGIDETVPATVLDPFCGSGTTCMVAQQLGRNSVGLDLSYTYLHDQARERTGLAALDAWHNGIKDESDLSGLPLFAAEAE